MCIVYLLGRHTKFQCTRMHARGCHVHTQCSDCWCKTLVTSCNLATWSAWITLCDAPDYGINIPRVNDESSANQPRIYAFGKPQVHCWWAQECTRIWLLPDFRLFLFRCPKVKKWMALATLHWVVVDSMHSLIWTYASYFTDFQVDCILVSTQSQPVTTLQHCFLKTL